MHGHGHGHGHGHDDAAVVHSAYVPDHDHEHDDDPVLPLEDNPIWRQDNVELFSVGMDIGSSGTQVLFSRLLLRRLGEDLTSRFVVVRRETVHRSPVALTPYVADRHEIDAEALGAIIDSAYAAAGVDPREVDTGVVILTGEALRRDNAERISRILAERGGTLVTATAGHHMEAMLAGYGSGAALVSYETGQRLLNVDVGGGTTKLAVLDAGRVVATGAVHVGGRLVVVDDLGTVVRLEPAGRDHAARAGVRWSLGERAEPADVVRVAEAMADALVAAVVDAEPADDVAGLWLTDGLGGLAGLGPVDGVMFSGGVAEFVYDREDRDFGDLGGPLGRALRSRVESGALPVPLLPAGECIRATALGASEYSVQLSGSTGRITDPDALLPRRDLPVVQPFHELGEDVDAAVVAAAVRRQVREAEVGDDRDVVLAMSWSGLPTYQRLRAFAAGVRDGLADRTAAGRPVYLVLDADVALTVGRLLEHELGVRVPLFVVDGLALRAFDHVDLGRVRHPSGTVPVTIKSLVFERDPRR